jgi:hypothetical protein
MKSQTKPYAYIRDVRRNKPVANLQRDDNYGVELTRYSILHGDRKTVGKFDVIYAEDDGSMGRLASFVYPDELVINGVEWYWNGKMYTYDI